MAARVARFEMNQNKVIKSHSLKIRGHSGDILKGKSKITSLSFALFLAIKRKRTETNATITTKETIVYKCIFLSWFTDDKCIQKEGGRERRKNRADFLFFLHCSNKTWGQTGYKSRATFAESASLNRDWILNPLQQKLVRLCLASHPWKKRWGEAPTRQAANLICEYS